MSRYVYKPVTEPQYESRFTKGKFFSTIAEVTTYDTKTEL